ncbi:MAG: circularly permuted type 2 ATP-grasp protein [Planctomycetales bacterium]|nr:circularly permuted type 2 ATP-grasp protein [Planctomycetales bacterium]
MQDQQQTSQQSSAGSAPLPVGPSPGFLSGYQSVRTGFNELLTPDGRVRPLWDRFIPMIERLQKGEFERRWRHSQRLIRENGITYSPYGDPDANARPWELDALPLLIHETEWREVSAAIVQRAELLQLVLSDLYGPQRLLKEAVIPPAVLYAHPGFQLAYHGLKPDSALPLHYYAADLARAPDGKWWVLADRSEAPSGIGFALENRIVISRMLPEIYRKCNVRRLAPFFIAFEETLQELAGLHSGVTRAVILSRGPQQECYFEDAYLARYLGHTLVEGADLAFRDGRVYLKTLDGLLPIDVILRRPNSEDCDPLEFSADSSAGVAGLLQAVRSGSVALTNPLGSGLVESPIFMAFMPRLCRFFLQQDLAMPGIATWWCGEPNSLEYVVSRLDRLTITEAYRHRGQKMQPEQDIAQVPPHKLEALIRSDPNRFVAQERLASSVAPLWKGNQLVSARLEVRAFSVAHRSSFKVMEGGLTRTTTTDSAVKSDSCAPFGRGCKDTWIVGDQPVEYVSLLTQSESAIELRRVGSDLPSRVADNIFWLGRQIERADAAARLLRTFILQATSETPESRQARLAPLLRALASQGQIDPGYALENMKGGLPDIESAMPQLIFDEHQPSSLRSVLEELSRVASVVRDRLSVDSWRTLVRIDQRFRSMQVASNSLDMTDVLNFVNGLIIDLAAMEGFVMESMTRSHVFRFLDFGRRLERAHQMTALLRSCFVGKHAVTGYLLEAVLEIADSVMTYRSRYLLNLQLAAVLDLLITDETNPRSIAFQLVTLRQHAESLPRHHKEVTLAKHEKLILSMVHSVRMLEIQHFCEPHGSDDQHQLESLLAGLERKLPALSHELANRYLVHTSSTRTWAPKPVLP